MQTCFFFSPSPTDSLRSTGFTLNGTCLCTPDLGQLPNCFGFKYFHVLDWTNQEDQKVGFALFEFIQWFCVSFGGPAAGDFLGGGKLFSFSTLITCCSHKHDNQLFYSSPCPSFEIVPGFALRNYKIIVKLLTDSDAARCIIWSNVQSWKGYAFILFIVI